MLWFTTGQWEFEIRPVSVLLYLFNHDELVRYSTIGLTKLEQHGLELSYFAYGGFVYQINSKLKIQKSKFYENITFHNGETIVPRPLRGRCPTDPINPINSVTAR